MTALDGGRRKKSKCWSFFFFCFHSHRKPPQVEQAEEKKKWFAFLCKCRYKQHTRSNENGTFNKRTVARALRQKDTKQARHETQTSSRLHQHACREDMAVQVPQGFLGDRNYLFNGYRGTQLLKKTSGKRRWYENFILRSCSRYFPCPLHPFSTPFHPTLAVVSLVEYLFYFITVWKIYNTLSHGS